MSTTIATLFTLSILGFVAYAITYDLGRRRIKAALDYRWRFGRLPRAFVALTALNTGLFVAAFFCAVLGLVVMFTR